MDILEKDMLLDHFPPLKPIPNPPSKAQLYFLVVSPSLTHGVF